MEPNPEMASSGERDKQNTFLLALQNNCRWKILKNEEELEMEREQKQGIKRKLKRKWQLLLQSWKTFLFA